MLSHEMEPVPLNAPVDALFAAVGRDESFEVRLALNHEELIEISDLEALVGLLGRASDLIANCVEELIDEELVSLMRHSLALLAEDLGVAALDEVLLKAHRHLDEDVVVLLVHGDQLDLGVVLGDLVVGK